MPFYTLIFNAPTIEFNVSLQVGDTIYYCPSNPTGGFDMVNMQDVTVIGELIEIGNSQLVCHTNVPLSFPPTVRNADYPGDFIMFSKENEANLSSLLGYVAEVEFSNNSTGKVELFSIGAEVSESSK
jgi:hypothetical protein